MKKIFKITLLAITVILLLGVCVSAAELTLSPADAEIYTGGSWKTGTYAVSDVPDGKLLHWDTSDPSVATVTGGTVSAVSPGTATITAWYLDDDGTPVSGAATITVKEYKLDHITVENNQSYLVNQEIKKSDFAVIGVLSDGSSNPITQFDYAPKTVTSSTTEVTVTVTDPFGSAATFTDTVTIQATEISMTDLVAAIEISEPAPNTVFKTGDILYASNVEIKITDIYGGISYKKVDGTDVKWNLNGSSSYTFSNDDAKSGKKAIAVSYAGKTASVTVKVASSSTPTTSGFSFTYTTDSTAKTSYVIGEKFSTKGFKIRVYAGSLSDNKEITSSVSNLVVNAYTFDEDDVGTNVSITLIASFTYDNKTQSANITISGLTVIGESTEELDVYEIDTVSLAKDRYAIGYEIDPDHLDEEISYIKVVLYADRKTGKTTKIYAEDFDDYANDFNLVVLDDEGDAKSVRYRYIIEEDDVYTDSGEDVVNLLFVLDKEEYQLTVPVGDMGVKYYYNGDLITSYDDLEDALYYTHTQDKSVKDDFDLKDIRASKPIVLKLSEDKKVSSAYEFDPEHNIEIDLNGHKLTFYSDTISISKANKNNTVTVRNTAKTDATFTYSDKNISVVLKQGDSLTFEYDGELPGFVTVTIDCGKNGVVSEKSNVIKNGELVIGKGSTLTFTIKPNTGYEIKDVTVDGASVIPKTTNVFSASSAYTVNSSGIATYTMKNVTKKCTLAATFVETTVKKEETTVQTNWTNPFTDVTSRDKYYAAVEFVCTNQLFNGVSASKFAPENTMTRAMFVTVLGRLAAKTQNIDFSEYTASSFTDVSASNPQNGYAAPYIEWAARNSIVEGYGDGAFGPNNNITHQQMYLIMQRYASFIEHQYTDASQTTLNVSDASSVADWAVNGVKYAQQKGLLISTNRVDPTGNALRWELATELMLFCKNVLGWKIP